MKGICSDFNYEKEIELSISLLQKRMELKQSEKDEEAVASTNTVLMCFNELKQMVKKM